MSKARFFSGIALAVAFVVLTCGCSDNKASNNNNPPVNQREFVSGDLSSGESFQHTFNTARSINYYCRYHGGPGLQGMSGTITVTATGTAETRNVSIVASTLPDISIAVGSTIRWTNNTSLVHTVESDD